ncbi:MAG: CheR family methyltransferase [Desulfobacterales bacterium]|jgi:SAM-dependent methyltransferase
MTAASFDDLVEQFLGQRLPPSLAEVVSLATLPGDARDLILRMLALMKRARYPATDINAILLNLLTTMVPTVLPCSWGGRIPPLTVPGRHRKLDAYVRAQDWPHQNGTPLFLDMGCGFPPVTSVETALNLPDWKVLGVDRFFADYVVYDAEGHYACLDGEGVFQYFQPQMTRSGLALYADPAATRTRFENLYHQLVPQLANQDDRASETVTLNGHRLVHHHIRDFETANLSFLEAEIDDLEVSPAEVIRCMNVLIYFPPPVRAKMLQQAGRLLAEGGLLIAGTSGFGIDARYTVFRKQADGLVPREFAFGLENLRSIGIMPYFTLHGSDAEAALLADLMGAIRADRPYWSVFSGRFDRLLARYAICRRAADGFLTPPPEDIPRNELRDRMTAVWRQMLDEGFGERTLAVLRKAGFDAWENAAGDIAIRPPADFTP